MVHQMVRVMDPGLASWCGDGALLLAGERTDDPDDDFLPTFMISLLVLGHFLEWIELCISIYN